MGARPFFYPGDESAARNVIHAALALAEFFHCSPFEFLDRDDELVLRLHHETLVMLRERKSNAG